MSELNTNDMIDLGSDPTGEDFDPFKDDDNGAEMEAEQPTDITETPQTNEAVTEAPASATQPDDVSMDSDSKAVKPKTEQKEPEPVGYADKQPVFEYAGATENIDDASKTFDELRIEKAADFPELEDGKRVNWTVEYGKITRTVPDPKGISIGKMKSDIETSKNFEDSLKKRGADKNPTCKMKPRVTAQSKGQVSAYRGVFDNLDEVNSGGKVISILPAKDGNVYEIRNTEMGRFTTQIVGCDLLSEVQAGFIPALPLVPMDLVMKVISFFRSHMSGEWEREALVNIYWDKQNSEYVVDAPEQTVTKASVDSRENPDYVSDRYIHYMDIHSHNSMKAFFSDVDDRDEKATRLYTVIGHLNEYFPDIKTRISNGGKFLNIDPSEVFELVAKPFPAEWKNKVRFRSLHDVSKDDDFKWPGGGTNAL